MTVLTLDLGTSFTKAGLWADQRLVALTRVHVPTEHPQADRAEQDPDHWWRSVVDACAQLRANEPRAYAAIDAVGCSGARETFACFDTNLESLGPGIVWSDSRAVTEAVQLGDPVAFRAETGVILTPSCCAAKMTWVRHHEPDWFRAARWLLAPRDFILGRLTGHITTDPTLASRTGLYDLDGAYRGDDTLGIRLPPIISSVEPEPLENGSLLELPGRARAILGAGDRACEAIGVGASAETAMVSWGTTANLSIPHAGPANALPTQGQVSRAAVQGFLVEAGLSAAGAALDWLSSLTGHPVTLLLRQAAEVVPGVGGLLAFPWLHGARAPWWRPEIHAAFVGISATHGPAELTRAVVEGVALDVARCVELLGKDVGTLALAGRGASDPLWRSVLAAAVDRPLVGRVVDDAASVGARLLVATARGEAIGIDDLNPRARVDLPVDGLVRAYEMVRERADRVAETLAASAP